MDCKNNVFQKTITPLVYRNKIICEIICKSKITLLNLIISYKNKPYKMFSNIFGTKRI